MARDYRSLTVTIRDDQYRRLQSMEEMNISGLVRKLLDAYFSGELPASPERATSFKTIGGGSKH